MPTRIELPQVGESVTEGIIGKWLKQIGERVEKYDPLVEVVTDKVNMEVPSPYAGTLTSILASEGDVVPMGAAIAEMDVEGVIETAQPEEPAAGKAEHPKAGVKSRIGTLLHSPYPMGPTGTSALESTPTQEPAPSQGNQRFSPAVRRLAQEQDVDLSKIKGTGMGGRVTHQDVLDFVVSQGRAPSSTLDGAPVVQAGPDEEILKLTPVRRMIADNMVKSSTQIPQAWSIVEVDVTRLVQHREALKDAFQREEGVPLTYLAFVIKTVVDCLKDHPLLNSSWGGDKIVLKRRINIGIAVAASHGLTVPVIHDADAMNIAALARTIADLTSRGRNGKLTLEDVHSCTFTVNNTGALGSVASRPLINPPQAAILTTEAIVKRPVVIDDAIAIRSIMNVTLTFDHRVMDGSEAGTFIQDLKGRLEVLGPDTPVY